MSYFLSDKEKIEIVTKYTSGAEIHELVKEYHKTHSSISGLLKRRNITIRPQCVWRKYKFDYSTFDVIDTQEKAYWLGFLLGDGWVDKYILGVRLHSKDIKHLQKFKKFMKAENPIKLTNYDDKPACIIKLGSKKFVDNMSQYGIVSRKTYKKITTPKQVPDNLLRHFYRGLFDADGHIIEDYKDKRSNGFGYSSYCHEFLLETKEWFNLQLGRIVGDVTRKVRDTGTCSQLRFRGNKIYTDLYHIMYDDATIYLQRKKKHADKLLKSIS